MLGIGLAATRDITAFFRGAAGGRAGHAEPGRRRDPPRGRDRRLAVGELHPDLHPPRLQRGRRRARGLGRRVPADRGAADADQRALRRAGRRRRAVRGGQRAGDLVGRLRGSGPPAPPRQPARSLHRVAHLSEDRRGVRIGGVLGPPHVAGPGRHRRPDATSRCRTTSGATTIPARRTAVAAAASRSMPPPAPPGCTLPANPNPQADTTRALTRALDRRGSSATPRRPTAAIRAWPAASWCRRRRWRPRSRASPAHAIRRRC